MAFEHWHLAVIVAAFVVLVALVGWGLRVSRRWTLLGLAATLVALSGWLLYTLVLEETDIKPELEDAALIGIPAILAVSLGLLAVKRTGSRQL